MQQSLFQPMLSVREAMVVAAHLKLGYDLNQAQKNKVVRKSVDKYVFYIVCQCQIVLISKNLL